MIERFIEFSQCGNIPNLIISGPPGCGKTTSVWALARDMLGNQCKEACLELNASDERYLKNFLNKKFFLNFFSKAVF